MENKKIVCTGGSGMVGRSLKEILPNAIYLSSKDYDLTSENDVIKMYEDLKPDIILFLSARVGGIVDNVKYPAEYFDENILMDTLTLKYARIYGIKKFVGILSTCIYPDVVETYPMTENMLHLGAPTKTNFSYGYAKRAMAVQIDAYREQYGLKYNYLTPANMYCEYDKYGENSHFIGALIKKIILAKRNGDDTINLFGTGKPLRQFMYAKDFAKIIKSHIENDIDDSYNVTLEESLTIKEMAEIALKACDAEHLDIKFDPTKPDGQYRKDVSINKFRKHHPDFKFTNLHEGIRNTYRYLINNDIIK